MDFDKTTRRQFIGTALGGAAAGLVPGTAVAQGLKLRAAPVTLSIVDVAGNLALTQKAF